MKKLPLLLFTLVIIACACEAPINQSEKASNLDHPLNKKLDEYFLALSKLKKFNGAVLIQKEDDTVLFKAYNMDEDVNSSLYVHKDSQFDVHSISKLMAQACIVQLEKEGLIDTNDKVSDYIPYFPKGDQISIQYLLKNQSGLPRDLSGATDNLIDKTPSDFVDLIKKEELIYAPGSETLYSNLGYQLVYYIISQITGKSFVQYLRDAIFQPLSMNDSGAHFFLDKSNLTRPVKNHIEENGKIEVVTNYGKNSKNQSRVYSTLEDLQKFINEAKKEPYRSALKNKGGNIGWSGGGDGILSHAEAKLDSGYELIFFSNYDEIPFGRILEDVEKIITGTPYVIPKEINRRSVKLDKTIIQQYVGKYDMAEFNHDEFEIRMENDSAVFYQNGERGGILKAENDSTFFGDPKDEDYFIFRKGRDGSYHMVFKYKGVDIVGMKK